MAISLAEASDGEPMSQMNTTPLIDVMLVLLIMFIITLPIMTHAVKLEVQGDATLAVATPIDLTIEYDGTILWNGEVVSDYSELTRRVRTARAGAATPELRVRAEPRAAYDTVAKVLAVARRNGIERIGIVGNE